MFSFLNIRRGATANATANANSKAWLAAILVAAFSLTGLVPAHADPLPAITLDHSGASLGGTVISDFDPTLNLQVQLTVDPSASVANPTLNFTDTLAGVTFAQGSATGSASIALEGTQAALNSAFASITLGEFAEATTVSANVLILSEEFMVSSSQTFVPTEVTVGAVANLFVSPGEYPGGIEVYFERGVNYVNGQFYTVTLTQGGETVAQHIDVVPGLSYFDSIATDILTTVTVTPVSWDNQDGITRIGGSSVSATTLAQGSGVGTAATAVWTDEILGPFHNNRPYSDGVLASSDNAVTYAVTSGTLPIGVTLNKLSGQISGNPTGTDQYDFTVTAKTTPNWVTKRFSGRVNELRGCESYIGASYASNILLNPDGTPIGCDYSSQPTDLRPTGWDASFRNAFGSGRTNNYMQYETRLGYACDDCSIGAGGETGSGAGIPIGFDVNFFGTTYSDLFVNSNGSIAFGHGSGNYNEPLDSILDGAAGLVPWGVDLDNRDVTSASQAWGTGERHADFFYWGRTTYEGQAAFVVTWMNSQIYRWNNLKDFNTFQIIIVNNGDGDADYIINYGSTQDRKNNAGYFTSPSQNYYCAAAPLPCLAAGVGSNQNGSTLYASLQDDNGYLYNGTSSADAVDGAPHALNQATLNSSIPGQFIFHMVNGYVPEVATVPGVPLNLALTNTNATVDASWSAPTNMGGAPISGYNLRYRLAGTTDAWVSVQTSSLSQTINSLEAGTYSFQVAATNEIGTGSYSRSYTVAVAGPVYASMVAYNEAVNFAHSLNSDFFTSGSWSALVAALSGLVTRTDSQALVDAQTTAINDALAGLLVAFAPFSAANFTDYIDAVTFAGTLHQADFTSATWGVLVAALAVDVSAETDQAVIDAQTAAINAAIAALELQAAGQNLTMSDLTAYNAILAQIVVLNSGLYTPASWNALANLNDPSITRNTPQSAVDAKTAALAAAFAALVPQSNMIAYNQAVSDASALIEGNYSPASWAALVAELAVPVDATYSQRLIDYTTADINDAISGLVVYANVTAYNLAVAEAHGRHRSDYTRESWDAVVAALAIAVNRVTDPQIFVDIATTNIVSAMAALVSSDGSVLGDLTNYLAARALAAGKIEAGYTAASWAALQTALTANVVTDANTQAEVDNATRLINLAIEALASSGGPIAIYEPYNHPVIASATGIIKYLAISRLVKKVLKNRVPVLIGKSLSAPVLFGGISSQLTATAVKALKKFAAEQHNRSGWFLVSGFVQYAGKNAPNAARLSLARAKNVAKLLRSLGVKASIGYSGFGAININAPSAADRKVEIRWVPAL